VVRTRWIFLRGLAAIFLIAFVSLWSQVDGLIGSHGILPAAELMNQAADRIPGRIDILPTLAWFSSGDVFLHALCASGVLASLAALAGIAESLSFFVLWVLYLSLAVVSSEFLSFQWDNLLLETGFLAVFFAPCRWRPRWTQERIPPIVSLWLLRWLLFRLMFESGLVKLLSGDPAWRDLTALQYHFETQPLPTWLGWYAHQLQSAVLKGTTGAMFAIELVVPFFIFLGRSFRLAAALFFIGFQIIIGATGNYGFFNLLTILLCLPLLDDDFIEAPGRFILRLWRKMRQKLRKRFAQEEVSETQSRAVRAPRKLRSSRLASVMSIPLAALVIIVSGTEMVRLTIGRAAMPGFLVDIVEAVSPFRSINRYGLFAVMTTHRPELVVEGSWDGLTWKEYEFKWKPGSLAQPPRFVEPHMPRLDWQMWFAALGRCEHNPWFQRFEEKLLEGSPPVLGLLKNDPFAGQSPNFIRTDVYEYHFTDPAAKSQQGTWWRREYRSPYCPMTAKTPIDGSGQKDLYLGPTE